MQFKIQNELFGHHELMQVFVIVHASSSMLLQSHGCIPVDSHTVTLTLFYAVDMSVHATIVITQQNCACLMAMDHLQHGVLY